MAVLVCVCSVSFGTTYYVATDGDDGDTGGVSDPFATIQKGVDTASGGTSSNYDVVYVNAGEYITWPILMDDYDNVKILFDPNGVVVKADPDPNAFQDYGGAQGDRLFSVIGVENIIIEGYGATFQMRRDLYVQEENPGAGRHVIALRGCKNVKVKGMTVKNGGGDGIYIGSSNELEKWYCEDILIKDVNSINNYRCGMGVPSAKNLTIEGCTLQGTNGTSPECGIDFEPNGSWEYMSDIKVRDCTFINNKTDEIIISCRGLDSNDEISILIEDCDVSKPAYPTSRGIIVTYLYDDGPTGEIRFKNVDVHNCSGIIISDKSPDAAKVVFEDCTVSDVADGVQRPIRFRLFDSYDEGLTRVGGVEFIDCQVFDDDDRPGVAYQSFLVPDANWLEDVHGDIYVDNPNCSGELFDWSSASTLVNVDLKVHSGDLETDGACQIHYVSDDLMSQECYDTIAGAISDSDTSDGDTIEVQPGTYEEMIDFGGKAITLTSSDADDWDVVAATVIDANSLGDAVTFDTSEDANSVLTGFTITGADGSAGVYCSGTSPAISQCIIRDNVTGIYGYNSLASVTNCKFYDNTTGFLTAGGSDVLSNSLLYGNTDAVKISGSNTSTLSNNTIANNSGYGIRKSSGNPDPTIINSILWGNGTELHSSFNDDITYSCIEGWSLGGTGNISGDPDFVNATSDNYHLDPNSPCIDAGDAGGDYSGQLDIDGEARVQGANVNMGADECMPNRVENLDTGKWYVYIQDAIDDADDGDTLEAAEYVYEGYLTIDKPITLRSSDPDDWDVVANTVIDLGGFWVHFASGCDANSVLTGFTVQNGTSTTFGAILVYANDPIISRCIVKDNSIGLHAYYGTSPTFQGNWVYDNTVGVHCIADTSKVLNNLIYYNDSGIRASYTSSASIYNNTIVSNTNYGIEEDILYGTPTPDISNCIVWDNGTELDTYFTSDHITYSCIKNWTGGGTGNTTGDPDFVDDVNYDYSIGSSSSCIDAADGDAAPSTDIDGYSRVDDTSVSNTGVGDPNYVDIGAYEYQP